MYKPNFCSECGSTIERSRWRVWTSRRFCQICSPRFRRARVLLPLFACATVFTLGLIAGRTTRPTAPPLIVERGEIPLVSATQARSDERAAESGTNSDSATPKKEPTYGPDGTPAERPTEPDEVVSICGARTQKGTPCQRRVRGTGRCWQHRGLPAMIPAEKRIITGP